MSKPVELTSVFVLEYEFNVLLFIYTWILLNSINNVNYSYFVILSNRILIELSSLNYEIVLKDEVLSQ